MTKFTLRDRWPNRTQNPVRRSSDIPKFYWFWIGWFWFGDSESCRCFWISIARFPWYVHDLHENSNTWFCFCKLPIIFKLKFTNFQASCFLPLSFIILMLSSTTHPPRIHHQKASRHRYWHLFANNILFAILRNVHTKRLRTRLKFEPWTERQNAFIGSGIAHRMPCPVQSTVHKLPSPVKTQKCRSCLLKDAGSTFTYYNNHFLLQVGQN